MDERFMEEALLLAKKAVVKNEVPVGAVIVKNGKVIARGYNRRERTQDATMHAEMIAIRRACRKLRSWRLTDCQIYVTLEPCPMCAGAIVNARISHLIFGAFDPKNQLENRYDVYNNLRLNHKTDVTGGAMEEQCKSVLTEYFRAKR